jgi:short subunit dehydrogenase-like uncharacterized protein
MRIAIYGATGFTGQLIARALAETGAELILSGRDRARLDEAAAALDAGAEVRPAPVHDRDALAAALRGADLVVGCAGPFSQVGEPVVREAIAAGADYLDITGEQHFMREVYERYESAARHAGVCVVNGFGFEIALGDLAAALAGAAVPGRPLDEVAVYYLINRFRPTRGTQRSAVESLRGPGCVWNLDRWDPVTPAAERRTIGDPEMGPRTCVSFPSGEVITVPRHLEVRRVQTYLGLTGDSTVERLLGRAAGLLGPAVGFLARTPLLAQLRAALDNLPAAPSDDDRDDNAFAIIAEARRGFERQRVTVRGRDIYGVTAAAIAWAAAQLGSRDRIPAGVLAPAEAFDPEAALAALATRCTLELSRSTT